MIVEIRLLARLLRIPLLRVEGVVAISETDAGEIVLGHPPDDARGRVDRPRAPLDRGRTPAAMGRDLAVAEAIMAELDARPRPR